MTRRWKQGVAVCCWLAASSSAAQGQPQAGAAPQPPSATTTTTTTVMPYFPGGGITGLPAPAAGAQPPKEGAGPSGGTETQHGDANGPIFTTNPRASGRGEIPVEHVVKHGDTLSTLADQYLNDGSLWPQLWALNPHIQNPNWLYPGDRIKLREGAAPKEAPAGASPLRRRTVAPNTIFLRNEGFIEDAADEDWGELVGSPRDNMFLGVHNETYLHLPGKRGVRIGREFTLFRHVRDVPGGKIIRILGTVRVNAWDPAKETARATIIEALDAVERGARVGPLVRQIEIVPPVVATRNLKANILATIYPLNFYGQNQVVFIDKGKADGLKSGNRLRIYRQGDAWRRSLVNPSAGKRIPHETEGVPEVELVPEGLPHSAYPVERVAELRVIRVRDHTSTCLVIESALELDIGDTAWLRKGF